MCPLEVPQQGTKTVLPSRARRMDDNDTTRRSNLPRECQLGHWDFRFLVVGLRADNETHRSRFLLDGGRADTVGRQMRCLLGRAKAQSPMGQAASAEGTHMDPERESVSPLCDRLVQAQRPGHFAPRLACILAAANPTVHRAAAMKKGRRGVSRDRPTIR
jgi:hypothetical protein